MIGMVGGCGMPKTGVAYLAWNEGTVDCREPDFAYQLICDPAQQADCPVDAVDGLLIATQYDVAWREDLFVNFDFMMYRSPLRCVKQDIISWSLIRRHRG